MIGDAALARRVVEGGSRRLAERFSDAATVEAYLAYFERVAREGR